ncbi:MAG: protease pro-enzyme activation domain-containing protein, partial [Verrucomicrobiota bacterium]
MTTRLNAFFLTLFLFNLLCAALARGESQAIIGHIPDAIAALQPIGRLAGTNRLNLTIGLPLRNGDKLGQLLKEITDPASPNFRHYLTPAQFAEQFGPSEVDYQAVIAFATAHGLEVSGTHPNRMLLDVRGNVAEVEQALHVKMQIYQHPTEARTFYAPDRDPSLELATPVLDVSGLQNYSRPQPRMVAKPLVNGQKALPNAGSGPSGTYMGNDFRAAYVPDTTMTGSGQSVGLLEFDGYATSDITYYESKAGLPSVTLSNVLLDGFGGQPTGSGGEVEVSLDIEVAISMAPGLSGVIVYEAGPDGSFHDILNRMANDNLAKQMSCSWYDPSVGADPVAEQIFHQMAVQGQSFFDACGDYDAYTGPIPFAGDSPSITQVGGTTLTTTGPGGSWVSEEVWNWGNGVGGAGGISTSYPIPSYQTNISMTANQGSTTMRNIPDVALTADNVYTRADGVDRDLGGTSCAAPLWAGFIALVNQQAAMYGRPMVGFINPALDVIGTGQYYTSCFHDITNGNNTSPSSPSKFYAVSGYDLCTGWGVPAGQNLINALATPDPLTIQPNAGFTAIGGSGGPFTVTSENFVLINSGTNELAWSLVNTSLWLTVSPQSGTLAGGSSNTAPAVSLSAGANTLPIGNYSAAVAFSNITSGFAQTRQFTLQVVPSVSPTILTPPASQSVAVGSNATFSVSAGGTPPLNYQWQVNTTNINGATNASLTVTNVGLGDAGSYTVTVSNTLGSTNAMAMLTVGYSPSITTQPQSIDVVQGTNVSFIVGVGGTGPFNYQWYFYSVAQTQDTNSTLTLTNVQPANAGYYSVVVSSPFGSIVSSDATLTVDAFPIIVTQPQSQNAVVGTNVTFSVSATSTSSVLPPVSSGTLQLWLRADEGVVTNSAGLVSQWQDQSGNANHASQSNANQQPRLISDPGLGGRPALLFNGIQDNVNGSYLTGSGQVAVPKA